MVTDGGEESNKVKNSQCNEDKFNCIFKYYEKAIEGRNFHYHNYNTWANYYSIFTGALFVGFYQVNNASTENAFFKILIILVGLITSICWNLTVKGHYHWMLSWINVVQGYEKELANLSKKNEEKEYYVYYVYKNTGKNFLHKNISSQKLTSKFTFFISIAWAFLLSKTIYDNLRRLELINFLSCSKSHCCLCALSLIFSIVTTIVIYILCYLIFDRASDVSEMKKNITENHNHQEKYV